MTRLIVRTALAGVLILNLLGLTGCLTAVREVTGKALEDRSHADLTTDTNIQSYLDAQLHQQFKDRDLAVKFDVWEQRVLVTGTVKDPGLKTQIGALVKEAPNVREVYNEVLVVSPGVETAPVQGKGQGEQKTEEGGVRQTIDDAWIFKKIEAKLLGAPAVHSTNYRWRVVQNTVYLIGRARTQTELDRVLELCRNTNGVKEVRHVVEIKPA